MAINLQSLEQISEDLARRVITCLPAATFDMETLLHLARIEATFEVPTAAVECRRRPRLLVNPMFVETHCRRDEHLFLLVMHELWHVILAHTKLYPRLTPLHNIAFDAVINAGLAREFPGPEYRGFLEAVNPADEFPGVLLRPPEGWPDHPAYRDVGPARTRHLVMRLYPSRDKFSSVAMPLYEEILELLANGAPDEAAGFVLVPCKGPAHGKPFKGWAEPVLIGDHEDPDKEERSLDDPLFGDVVRRIVASWPAPPFPLGGRDAGGQMRRWADALSPTPDDVRAAFACVLRRTLGRLPDSPLHRKHTTVIETSGVGVLPNACDRLAPARRALGAPDALWQQRTPVAVRLLEPRPRAHVYLDVSGSMSELLPYLASLLVPYAASGAARVFQFSTCVEPLAYEDLRQGELRTTGGTDITCVFDHLLEDHQVQRTLILTDGYTGEPLPSHIDEVRSRRVRVHVVLPSESEWRRDLEGIAATTTVLPPLRPQGRAWRFGA